MSEQNGKKLRGDILHEQLVRLGEIEEPKPPVNKKKIALVWLIVIAIIAALLFTLNWRLNLIEGYLLQELNAEDYMFDGAYGPYYRAAQFGLLLFHRSFR